MNNYNILFIILCVVIFSANVSALWSNNTFNNSLAGENLTFTGSNSFTRYLAVPEAVTKLGTAIFSILGFYPYPTFSGNGSNDFWEFNNTINSTMNATLTQLGGTVSSAYFNISTSHYLIVGNSTGLPRGFNWNGSGWIENSSVVSGVSTGSLGSGLHPTVVAHGTTFYLFFGGTISLSSAFNWNSTGWVVNISFENNFSADGVFFKPKLFTINNGIHMIIGTNAGGFNASSFNGTVWFKNFTLHSGLSTNAIGQDGSSPTIFNFSGLNYLISGHTEGNFSAWSWNGSGWNTNNNFRTGLGDVGSFSHPNAFYLNSGLYLLAGNSVGKLIGFNNRINSSQEFATTPIALWLFDNNISADVKGLYNWTTVGSGVSVSQVDNGYISKAVRFNASNPGEGMANVTNSHSLITGTAGTWNFFMNFSNFTRVGSPDNVMNIFGEREIGGDGNVINFRSPGGINLTRFDQSPGVPGDTLTFGQFGSCSQCNLNYSQWHMFTTTWNSSGARVYIDGVLRNETTSFTVNANSGNFSVFDYFDNSITDLIIDEISIINRSLSPSEVTQLFNRTVLNASLSVGSISVNANGISANGTIPVNITLDVVDEVNSYLGNCTIMAGNCNVPFFFGSGLAGVLQYFGLNFVEYQNFTENNQSFRPFVYDTQVETFTINITIDSSFYNNVVGTLVYNGTRTIGQNLTWGDNFVINASQSIPPVNMTINKTFYWEINLFSNFGQTQFNSSTMTQTVNPSTFIQCGVGNLAVNYTIRDEETQLLIGLGNATNNVSIDFEGFFEWRLNKSSIYTKNANFSLHDENTFKFCTNNNETYFTDIDLLVSATEYTPRSFGFNDEEFNNVTKHQPLFLLNVSLGTDVIIKLKDAGLFALPGYTIKIFRKLSSGSEILVENDITDFIGQIVARLIENEVKYRILFFDEENVLVKTVETAIVACTTPICQQTFIIQELTGAFDDFNPGQNYTSSLTFDNNSRIFNFVWVDNSDENPTYRLLVEKITFSNGTQVVYNQSSSLSSGVLSYEADTSRASYRASAFRKVGIDEDRIELLTIEIGSSFAIFHLEGLYWSFILFMLMLLVGRFYPPIGVFLYLFSVFMLGIFDIVFINPAIIIAEIVLGVIFIWAFRG